MAVRLSALSSSHPLAPGRFLVLIYVRGCVDPRAIVWLEGLGQLKNPKTFQLVAQCLSQLCPVDIEKGIIIKILKERKLWNKWFSQVGRKKQLETFHPYIKQKLWQEKKQ
jgi:hypothetical protein